ncbi:hypothetical protein PACTADRAFT_35065 [Pachysolen tannophilus NRRL Y-2460]|uniref:RecQ mediated genome instability protein 1 OB-fold domain-containing protein n=1 Tax=Pachysolen tannophilus NRRL Y-2460 TaxID=669874 RepID=A0A1E4TR81_PACTA|nr:hypothetical protein PACTADRAFT_35065 [Pachysolen tannophilus NRRL Y-2460]
MTNIQLDYRFANVSKNVGNLLFKPDQLSQLASKASKYQFNPSIYVNPSYTNLPNDTLFQILYFEDVTRSKLNILANLQELNDPLNSISDKLKKNNRIQQVISNHVELNDNVEITNNNSSSSTIKENNNVIYKLLLQDCFGNLSYAIPLENLEMLSSNKGLLFPQKIGSKIIIKKNCQILNGCILLTSKDFIFLGGEIPGAQNNETWIKSEIAKLENELSNLKK